MKKIITAAVLLVLTLLCCSGCAQNVGFYSAKIYRAGIESDEPDKYVYIKSIDDLKNYSEVTASVYDNPSGPKLKKVFDVNEYSDAFF